MTAKHSPSFVMFYTAPKIQKAKKLNRNEMNWNQSRTDFSLFEFNWYRFSSDLLLCMVFTLHGKATSNCRTPL